MKYVGRTNEYFEIIGLNQSNTEAIDNPIEGQLSVIWFLEDGNKLIIDSQSYSFKKNQLICLTSFHKVEIQSIGESKILP